MAAIRISNLVVCSVLLLAGCAERDNTSATAAAEPAVGGLDAAAAQQAFRERVAALADDRMEGRSPASTGEARTLEYLEKAYRDAGLVAPPGGDFRQAVPLVGVTPVSTSDLTIAGDEGSEVFAIGEDAMVWTKQLVDATSIDDSDVVYVGYGIVAPEYDWNDYAAVDVRGKTVIVLVNDPGFATRDPELFNGFAMTYYGRWTYKYEEAARQGAAAAIIVHESEAAGYPWQVVAGSWGGEQFDLVAADRNMSRARIEGWISRTGGQRLFAMAGLNYEEQRDAASQRGFQALTLPLKASAAVENTIAESESYNMVGIIPGSTHPDEYIVYSAHWDHLGVLPANERNFAQPDADRIFNGAKDNAAGVAMMLGVADAFANAKTQPERTIVFLAVTAEESGLLGSAWYGANPVFPLARTVANLNLDAPTLLGPTNDITVIGYGSSELEEILARYAERQGRSLQQEPTPEKGFFYRSDHFNFSKRGVPALYAKGGIDHRERGTEYGSAWEADYVARRYHKVADEYDPDWDLTGIVEDMELFYQVGAELASSRGWPEWYDGNEFKAIRDASAAERQ